MRHNDIVTIKDDGKEVTFRIRPMPALQMEQWLNRVAALLPPEAVSRAMSGPVALAQTVLERGILALACADPEAAAPLLDELLDRCVFTDPDGGTETPCSAKTLNQRLTSVAVLLRLRQAALCANLSFALEGARKALELPRESAFLRASAERTYARTANVPQVTAALISQGAASLNDLRTTYTYADALDLLEVLNVRNYNMWAMSEASQHRRR